MVVGVVSSRISLPAVFLFEATSGDLWHSLCFMAMLISQTEEESKDLIYFSKSVHKTDVCAAPLEACRVAYPHQESKLALA